MSRLALAVFVLAAVAAEARVSTWDVADAPWQRLAARAPEPSVLAQPASFDPFAARPQVPAPFASRESRLAWSGENASLEEILGSAIWRASAECGAGQVCGGLHDANALRPL